MCSRIPRFNIENGIRRMVKTFLEKFPYKEFHSLGKIISGLIDGAQRTLEGRRYEVNIINIYCMLPKPLTSSRAKFRPRLILADFEHRGENDWRSREIDVLQNMKKVRLPTKEQFKDLRRKGRHIVVIEGHAENQFWEGSDKCQRQ
jgi:hypothetical protein